MLLLILLPALFALALFLVAPAPRSDPAQQQRARFANRNYAHRGLFTQDQTTPENSLPAFEAAARAGYGIELDVQFTADQQLVVFHDDTLDRMTPAKGWVKDRLWQEVGALPLAGTQHTVPLFSQVLQTVAQADPATPLIVEIKSRGVYTGEYLNKLCAATLQALQSYPGPYCIESFDPRVVQRIRHMAPHVLRGQLADSYAAYRKNGSKFLNAFVLSHVLGNVLARPHFIAWCPAKRNWAVRLCRAMGAMLVYWTALPQDNAAALQQQNDAVIFQWYTPPTHY